MEMKRGLPLSQLPKGCHASVLELKGGRAFSARVMGMGLNVGSQLRMLHTHHHRGGPLLIGVGSSRLMIGHGMADAIIVEPES